MKRLILLKKLPILTRFHLWALLVILQLHVARSLHPHLEAFNWKKVLAFM